MSASYIVKNFRHRPFGTTGRLDAFLDCDRLSHGISSFYLIFGLSTRQGCKVFSLPLHHHPPARLSRCGHSRHPARSTKGGRRKGAHRSLRATLGPPPNDDILSWGGRFCSYKWLVFSLWGVYGGRLRSVRAVCMYVCMYVCKYVCMHACMHA